MNKTGPSSISGAASQESGRVAVQRADLAPDNRLDAVIAERTGRNGQALGMAGQDALMGRLVRSASRIARPLVRAEIDRQLAATGTDGMPLPYRTEATMAASLRSGTAMPAMAERLDHVDLRPRTLMAEAPVPPPLDVPSDNMMPSGLSAGRRPVSVRDAVAEIARRQAALDADQLSVPQAAPGVEETERATDPSASSAEPAPARDREPAAHAIGALGEAVSALEARLAVGRAAAARNGRAPLPGVAEAPAGPDAADETAVAFQALSRDLRNTMARIDGRRMPPSPAEAPAQPVADDELLGDIRSLLERFRPGSTLDSLDRRVKDLSEQLGQRADSPASLTLIEGLSRRVEEMHASLKASTTAPDMRQIDTLMRGVADRLHAAREATTDIQGLEEMVRRLSDKVEAAAVPFDTRAVSGLEAQLARLGERLERSEASLSWLDAVERSLGDLFTQIEQARHATVDAAESAARTAARDTLRAAIQHSAVIRPQDETAQVVEKFGQDMAGLRLQHEEAERRTQAALGGLHQTMERLLGHLEVLDLTGRQGMAASDARPSPMRSQEAKDQRPKARPLAPIQAAKAPAEPSRDEPAAASADPVDSLIEPRPGRGRGALPDVDVETRLPRGGAAAAPADGGDPAAVGAEGPATFIAAARRAAQAAQASVAEAQMPRRGRQRAAGDLPQSRSSVLKTLEQAKAYLAGRRRPVLLGLASLVLLLGALEIVRVGTEPAPKGDATITAQASPDRGRPAAGTVAAPGSRDGTAEGTPGRQADLSPLGAAPRPAAGQAPAVVAVPDSAVDAKPSAAPPVVVAPSGAADSPAAPAKPAVPRSANPFLAGLAGGADGLPERLKTLANAGDAAAEYEVGLRFAEGRTVARDPAVAATWFQKAAAQGLASAQYRLGSAYEKGIGETRDPALAIALYGRAAEAGNIRAMHNLAVMSAEGSVGKPDYAKAATWFAKAANFGVRDSQFNLAILYARGLGIEQDLNKSYMWFAVAAAQGDEDAAKKRDEVAARLDAKALDAAKAAAAEFHPATSIAAANEVAPPPGGWDAPTSAHPTPVGQKSAPPKAVTM